jgi:hypothetical protein
MTKPTWDLVIVRGRFILFLALAFMWMSCIAGVLITATVVIALIVAVVSLVVF